MGSIGDPHIFIFALFGGAIASWVMMRIKWLPDPPPPDIRGRYLAVLIIGVVGGWLGGYVARNDPMPALALVAAGSLSMILAGGIAILGSARKSSAAH